MSNAKMTPVRLFTPGPCNVPPDVLAEMSRPQEHHRTAEFIQIAKDVQAGLRYLFQTSGDVAIITGSGTAAMEMCQVGLMPRGDASKSLVVDGGKFGERWVKVCQRFDIPHDVIQQPWGTAVTADAIAEYLAGNPSCPAVVLVHSETSTATAVDLKAIADVVREHKDTLLIVDAITGVGSLPLKMDEWGIDAVVSGSQKALMLPPGLGFVGLGGAAKERLAALPKTPALYTDLAAYANEKAIDGNSPYTPNNQLLRGLHKVLLHIRSVGIETIWQKTAALAEATRAGCSAIGLNVYSQSPSDSVTAVWVPEGVSEKTLRNRMRDRFGAHLAGGQNELSGKVVRLNHMGWVDEYDTLAVLAGLELALAEQGYNVTFGSAVAAAQQVLAGSAMATTAG